MLVQKEKNQWVYINKKCVDFPFILIFEGVDSLKTSIRNKHHNKGAKNL